MLVSRASQALTLANAQALCAPFPGKNVIVGTDGADALDGTNKDDCIVAGSGNDRIHAGNGNDVVFAGDGADEVYGDNGDDILFLGAGNDHAFGGNGNDQISAEDGDDVVDAENGDDIVFLGPGNDRALGGNGNDQIHGDEGADVMDGQNGNDTLFGDACHDRIVTSGGTDNITGGDGTDACTGTQCEVSSGSPVCSANGNCASGQRCVIASGVCVALSAEVCETEAPPRPDAGTCTPSGTTESTCNGVDDDCDGRFDENFVAQTLECGVGACARMQQTSCVNGVVTGVCTPGTPATSDTTCDSIDDDCDGRTDESFISQASRCGVGACAVTGATSCVAGMIENSCDPGQPAANDSTCNAVDDDCNGSVDEDVVPQNVVCGIGSCAASGTRQCVNGVFVESCTPGMPTSADTVCNGIDDDCDGRNDEDYVAVPTSCGIGACASQGQKSCVAGVVGNSCQPGVGAPSDATCNATDDDCDGRTDEDALPVTVQCGVGGCARTGNVVCVGGTQQNNCVPGTPLAQDASCDGVDDDCDGNVDEDYAARVEACGTGACAAMGTTSCTAGHETISCTPGTAGSQDAACNGIDDDCDGNVDEDVVPQPSTCGVGACASSGSITCIDGALNDSCLPREPLPEDDTCNGIDDDCDGSTDENYVAVATNCGQGACARMGAILCVAGATHDSCQPGVPAADDAACNGRDDDCDGSTDEDYTPVQVACGIGGCTSMGSTSCVAGQVTNSCVAGMAASNDAVCNGIDDDCDGTTDEDAVPQATTCGVGACASTGQRACVSGAPIDSCQPGLPAGIDRVCNGVDEDCDGRTDEDYEALATHCGAGLCAASGSTACVNGVPIDSCIPHPPAASDANCDDRDDDCDGKNDESFAGADTICGVGACRAMGRTVCVLGVIADSCSPGPAAVDDATCDGVDDDCGGEEDEDYEALTTQCGVGSCIRSGLLVCVNGHTVDTCVAGTASVNDATCDAIDDDCDGALDEDFQSQSTQCGVGACSATGTTLCRSGTVVDTCTSGQATTIDASCDGRDDDCDGVVDENYMPQSTTCGIGACAATGLIVCVGGIPTTQCAPGSSSSAFDELCDGIDQDCDGRFDEDYAGTVTTCGTGICTGMGELRCVNGAVVDSCMARPSCEGNCDDGSDDDADGFVDCRDSDCTSHCERYCADGNDDDGDGDVDCADSDCAGQTGCVPEICGNSLDDDGDLLIDCADVDDCAGAAACPPVPPAAEDVAPPLDPGVSGRLIDRVGFLFGGPDPIQRGVAPGTIVEERVSIVTGTVTLSDGRPLSGVEITIADHPEFGLTHTDGQGAFHMVLNGGGAATVSYSLAGYINVHRQVELKWEDSATIDPVVLMPRSSVVSTIDTSGTATEYQVAAARTEIDGDGVRQAVVVFPPGVSAQVFDASGTLVNVPALNLRLTELTVGPSGRAAMPAELPPSSGYTYAIDITPDEANGIKLNGRDTLLSAPVMIYVDNFLSFPIGVPVPTGYYDNTAKAWTAVDSGLVIKILAKTGDLAEIDVDGDDLPEDAAELFAVGITVGERRTLAAQYGPGASLWRVALPHLSTYDMNMGAGADGTATPAPPPDDDNDLTRGPFKDPANPDCNTSGTPNSWIDCFTQTLGEEVPLAGTPYSLHYRSDRVPGRLADRNITIPVRTAEIDQMLLRGPGGSCLAWSDGVDHGLDLQPDSSADLVLFAGGGDGAAAPVCVLRSPRHLIVDVKPAGQKSTRYRWKTQEAPQNFTWTWSGKDDFGRDFTGPVPVSITSSFEYGCQYSAPARFGQYGGATLINRGTQTYKPRADCRVTLERYSERSVEYSDYRQSGLGGWSIDVNHRALMSNAIMYGDGTRGTTDNTKAIETLYARPKGSFGAAKLALGPDGTSYVITDEGIYRKTRNGAEQLWIPYFRSCPSFVPDQPRLCQATSIAVSPTGDVYIGDFGPAGDVARVVRVRSDGTMQRIAGGLTGYSPDGGPALQVRFSKISDLEVAPDGSIYVLDGTTRTVHRIGTDGIVQRIAGNSAAPGAFVEAADDARTVALDFDRNIGNPISLGGIAVDPVDGGLVIVEHGPQWCSTRHVSTTGRLTTIQRRECSGSPQFNDVVVDQSGQLILSGVVTSGIWRMDRAASPPRVERLAGTDNPNPDLACAVEGPYPTRQSTGQVHSVALGPDGFIYFNQVCSNSGGTQRVSRLKAGVPAGRLLTAPSTNAREVYEFDAQGRHLRTRSQLTGQELRRFEYNTDGHLSAIVEADGNRTEIEYDGGLPSAIVAPFGQRTELESDTNGFISRVQPPAQPSTQFAYNPLGLMLSQIDPRGSLHTYEYDALGRVSRDEDPAGGSLTFAVTNAPRLLTVTKTTALGQVTKYEWRTNTDGSAKYTITLPTGHANTRDVAIDDSVLTTAIDGTTSKIVPKGDPAFGMFAPLETETITTPNGLVRTLTRTRTTTVAPDGSAIMTEALNDNGRITQRSFAPSARTWTVTSPENRTVQVQLDSLARVVSSAGAGVISTTLSYDSHGRVDRIAQGTDRFRDFEFNAESGYLAATTDALAQTTSYETDTAGRITKVTAPDEAITSLAYDGEGHLTSVTPPQRPLHQLSYSPVDLFADYIAPQVGSGTTQTHTEYDLDRRRIAVIQPDGLQQTFVYHPISGLLISAFVPGVGTTVFGYDTRDRLTSATLGGAGTVALDYNGHLSTTLTVMGPQSVSDGSNVIWSGNLSGAIQVGYDSSFNVNSVSALGSSGAPNGLAVQYGRDRDDLITSVTPLGTTNVPTLTMTRSPLDGTIIATAFGALTTTQVTDVDATTPGRGVLKSLGAKFNGSDLFAMQYEHDALGRIRRVDEVVQGIERTRRYEYDAVGRLIRVRDGSNALVSEYTYDANGARTSAQTPTQQVSLGINLGCENLTKPVDAQDRLCRYGDYTYIYNLNGQLETRTNNATTEVTRYSYDGAGRLSRVVGSQHRIDYIHDALGRRIGKVVDGHFSKGWLYLSQLHPVAELGSTGEIEATYVYGDKQNVPEYIVRRGDGATYRIITDHLGSVRLVVDVATGSVMQRLDYDEYGVVLSDTNPGFLPFGFAGGLYDADTGLVRFGARDYEPETGRWTAKDPILFDGDGPNLYGYVLNNPLSRVDPTGEGFLDCGKAIADYVQCKSGDSRSADSRDKEMEECGGGNAGHKKAKEQKENRCERKKNTMIRACKDPEVYGPFLIVGAAVAALAIASGLGEIGGGALISVGAL